MTVWKYANLALLAAVYICDPWQHKKDRTGKISYGADNRTHEDTPIGGVDSWQ